MSLLLSRRGTLSGGGAAAGGGIDDADPLITTLGTASFQSSYNGVMGWEFEVGGSDLTAVGLRAYMPSAATRKIKLWAVTDSTFIDEVEVTTVVDEWTAGAITPTVLSASTRYIVGVVIGGTSYYRSNTGAADYTITGASYLTGRFNITPTAFPSSTANRIYGIADVLVEP